MLGDSQGLGRRDLIKRAAAAGVVAWTAPIVIDSLASPAGAVTGIEPCVGCYRLHVDANTACLKNWDNSCVPTGGQPACFGETCCDPTPNGSGACPSGYFPTTLPSSFCISVWAGNSVPNLALQTECASDVGGANVVEFRIDPACGFTFTAAFAHVTGAGANNCPSGSLVDSKTARFSIALTQGNRFGEFHLCISCATG